MELNMSDDSIKLQEINPDSLIAGLPIENQHIYLSVDKITILGSIKDIDSFLPDWEANHLDIISRRSGGKLYRYTWSITGNNYHIDAFPFNKTHDVRIEFNPNNVIYYPSLLSLIKNLIWSKLSRLDIAVDYVNKFNFAEYYVESLSKRLASFWNANTRHLTGHTFGSRNSDIYYRVYDKKQQLRSEKKIIANCDSWWRIEAEITPKNGKEWYAYSPFEDLTIGRPVHADSDLTFEETAILSALYNAPSNLDRLSEYKRRKYKKLMQSEINLESIAVQDHPYFITKHARSWLDDQIALIANTYNFGE